MSSAIDDFCAVTGEEPREAQFYLEASNNSLEVALAAYYEREANEPSSIQANVDGNLVSSQPIQPQPSTRRLGTLSDIAQKDDSSSDEEGQRFYAGGGEHSGQQIVGPGRKKNAGKVIDNLFQGAKEHGAEVVDRTTKNKKAPTQAFVGTGFKLGGVSPGDSVSVKGEKLQSPPLDIVLKLWKNGFSINDEELRPYDDPQSREFLEKVTNGEIPPELVSRAKGEKLNLDMEDHRNEDYVSPKKILKPFSGTGHTLGSVVSATVVEPVSPVIPGELGIALDENSPVTTLQLRLSDGSFVKQRFNLSHTVADIKKHLRSQRPNLRSSTLELQTTFPKKVLSNDSDTLSALGLHNAVVIVKIVD